jgi:hypothetical protein
MNVVGANLALTTDNANPISGQSITLTVTLSLPPSSSPRVGFYWIYDGSTVLVDLAVANTLTGYVCVQSGLSVGTHTLTAKYIGTVNGVTVSSNQLIVQVAAPTAATPTFSVAAGTYISAQSVTISDATSAATIYYTLF